MDRVDALVALSRRRLNAVVDAAAELLVAGVAADRVHRRFVSAAIALAHEAELRALLASSDDAALAQLERTVEELDALAAEAYEELDGARSEGGE